MPRRRSSSVSVNEDAWTSLWSTPSKRSRPMKLNVYSRELPPDWMVTRMWTSASRRSRTQLT